MNDINKLLDKYVSGNFTPEELEQLLNRLETSDKEYDEYLKPLWEAVLEIQPDENVEEIDQYKKEAQRIIQQHHKQYRWKKTIIQNWGRIAASIALLISTVSVIYWLNRDAVVQNHYDLITVTVQNGQKNQIYLEDSSSVFLNSGSQISYPESFDNKTREVILSGEAYFEINPDNNRPFFVKTNDVVVKVLGTSFNVKDYESDDYFYITVVTGNVSVMMDNNNINLLPDEQLSVHKKTREFKKKIVFADKYTWWREGTLCFNQTPLREVVATLERWYDVKIQMDNDYPISISGEHDNKSLTAVLETICFTSGLKYSKKENYYILFYP